MKSSQKQAFTRIHANSPDNCLQYATQAESDHEITSPMSLGVPDQDSQIGRSGVAFNFFGTEGLGLMLTHITACEFT